MIAVTAIKIYSTYIYLCFYFIMCQHITGSIEINILIYKWIKQFYTHFKLIIIIIYKLFSINHSIRSSRVCRVWFDCTLYRCLFSPKLIQSWWLNWMFNIMPFDMTVTILYESRLYFSSYILWIYGLFLIIFDAYDLLRW